MRHSFRLKGLGAIAGVLPVVTAAVVAALGAASPALAAPAGPGGGCPPPPPNVSAFGQWGDSLSYVPVNDGSFAVGGPAAHNSPWTLSGGASIVRDNDPSNLGGPGGFGALSLSPGASAVSACTTAPMIKTIVRFFVKNTGAPTGLLHVEVLVNDGKNGVLDGGTITAGSTWAPSPAISVPWPKPLKGAVNLRVRLTAVGTGASFEVDDVYLDPCRSR
jgi:hypothetical protein